VTGGYAAPRKQPEVTHDFARGKTPTFLGMSDFRRL
jgi:hypothetical protein